MRRTTFIAALLLLALTATPALAASVVYTSRAGWEAAVGAYNEEFFTDTTLNTDIAGITGPNVVIDGVSYPDMMRDVMDSSTEPTTFEFTGPIYAFGGYWDLAGPGGAGSELDISYLVGLTEVDVDFIPNTTGGTFWGFVSTDAFTKVLVREHTPSGGVETYTLDNMVYSAVPLPPAALMGFVLLGGLGFVRRFRRK
jgi:hypothetical protein